MAVYRARSVTSSYAIQASFSVSVPTGTQNGDLLIFAVAAGEIFVGASALIARPSGFTDLLTDGSNFGAPYGLQYVLDPGGFTPRQFVWVGYRVASSEPASYTVTTSSAASGFQGEMFAVALASDILATGLDHIDAAGGGLPVANYTPPQVTLDDNHRSVLYLLLGALMSTAVANNGYVPPAAVTLDARDAGGGAPNNSWTFADETVAGTATPSPARTFTILSGTITNRAAVVLSVTGTATTAVHNLPLMGAG